MNGDQERAPQTTGKVLHWAWFYDLTVGSFFRGKERAIREQMVDLAGLRPGESVLDVGCGTGSLAIVAKRRLGAGGTVCGIDASPEMIARARRKAEAAGLNVAFRLAAVERLPYPDATFDVVLSSLMIHHLPEELRRPAFAEIRRVLKPGGRLLIIDFEPPQGRSGHHGGPHLFGRRHGTGHNNRLSDNLPFVREAGFVDVETGPTQQLFLAYLRARAN